MFRRGPGGKPETKWGREIYFTDPQRIITLHPFTITLAGAGASAIAHVGNRPAWSMTGAGTATDGVNAQAGTAGIRPQAGETIVIGGTIYFDDVTKNEFVAGLHTVDTSIVAGLGTDYFVLSKLVDETAWKLKWNKASGAADSVTLTHDTLAISTWYRWEIWFTRDPSTAGKARYTVYWGPDSTSQIPAIGNGTIATLFPDTVSMAPSMAFRVGDADSNGVHVSRFGWDCFYDNLQG